MGYDSDDPMARGEVGKVGVAVDSLVDMRTLFSGLPLDQISTSMTINAPAATLLLLYQLVAAEQGIPGSALNGTVQNDVLKEYIARGTYIYPPRASLRLVSDLFAYCRTELPRWNTISISGYHMAEAGATPVQEVAFTLANAKEYVRAAQAAGLHVDDFAPRLSFFFVARTSLIEEVAKFRAARRIWAHIMRDEFGAQNPKSQMLRFHTQTAGVQLTAQQPEVNHRPSDAPGAGSCAGRHPVAAHERLRRGHRFADNHGRSAGSADPAGSRVRDRRDQDGGPFRGFVRRRIADRPTRGGGSGVDSGGGGAWGSGGRHRTGIPEERDRAFGLYGGSPDRFR